MLPDALYFPAGQAPHAMAPAIAMNLPAAQFGQKTWPDNGWFVLGKQLVQLAAFSNPENLPGGQETHRESSKLALSFSNVPGVHWSFTLQNGWPVCSWYLPAGHDAHALEFETELNRPIAHIAHVRSDVDDGAAATLDPAAQTACAVQNDLPTES
jgi:hypothetical protein